MKVTDATKLRLQYRRFKRDNVEIIRHYQTTFARGGYDMAEELTKLHLRIAELEKLLSGREAA